MPVVGFACDRRKVGHHPSHMVGEKYIAAVREGSGALPLLIPVLEPSLSVGDIVDVVDGLVFTGSPSNVAPRHYSGAQPRDGVLQDEHRDATTLPLLKAAIAAAKPILCICRGFQELNVALGGTLHQHVHEIGGRLDHRERQGASLEDQYGPSHLVTVQEGGLLATLTNERNFLVNSLHSQGIDQLAPWLFADAVAPDGQIEAVSMPQARGFLLGLQWHPEWSWHTNTVSRAILDRFGSALRA